MEESFKQVKWGAILSYFLMALNMIYSLWFTPFLLKNIGVDEYGLYKLVGSLSASLIVFNFGVGDTVQRYVSSYIAKDEKDKIPNLLALFMLISSVLCIVLILVGIIIILVFPYVYSDVLSQEQLEKANIMLIILIINIMITIIENFFSGVLSGYNDFIFINSLKIFSLVFRTFGFYFVVKNGHGVIGIAFITLLVAIVSILIEIFYSIKHKALRIKFEYWDKNLLRESGEYTILMFLTMLSSQAFTNVDNIVIGAFLGTSVVTLYSVGQFFFDFFQQISCAISGVMLPTITNVLKEQKGREKAEKIVIKAGRIQFILLGAAFAGLICVGKEFVYLWVGKGFEDVYIVILVLVGPSLLELCINVALSILRAENKIKFRTLVVFFSAIINALLTIILVKSWSYVGAAVATAVSYVLCDLIGMNYYYVKVIKINIFRIYKEILKGLLLSIIVPTIVLISINKFMYGTWTGFIVKILIFCIIYGIMLLAYGLNEEEKKQLKIQNS